MTKEPSAEEVIEAFGGPSETAKICEISKSAVSQWKNNGIPKAQLKFLKAARPKIFRQLLAKRQTEELPRG